MAEKKQSKTSARTPKQKVPTVTASEPAVEDAAPIAAGSEAALEKHRAAAEAIPESEVIPFRADAHLAYHNAIVGHDVVVEARARIDATGFRTVWATLNAIGEIGEAVIFADGRVDADPAAKGEILALLREARPLRALLLSEARTQALKKKSLLPEFKRIEKGAGPIDASQDLVDLATFFTRNKLAKKGAAVTPDDVKRASELGSDLLRRLKPTGAKRGSARSAEQKQAAALRDRMWTLLVRSYAHLECAAGAVWGRSLGEHVPSLQSRYVPAKRAAKVPPTSAPKTPG